MVIMMQSMTKLKDIIFKRPDNQNIVLRTKKLDFVCPLKNISKKVLFAIPENYDYKDLKPLAEGGYGVVAQTTCISGRYAGSEVAIKLIKEPFKSERAASLLIREVQILRKNKHENLVSILEVYSPENNRLENVYGAIHYIVMEYAGEDLDSKIKQGHKFKENEIIKIAYQVFKGIEYLHSNGIVHRDLKPSNIAVNSKFQVKLLDFGLARSISKEMSTYVTTRFYRAPEILCQLDVGNTETQTKFFINYNSSVDIWSLGCVIAELYLSTQLFYIQKSSSEWEGTLGGTLVQIQKIFQLCGTPSKEFLEQITYPSFKQVVATWPSFTRKKFGYVFNNPVDYFGQHFDEYNSPCEEMINLFENLFIIDPKQRPSASDALQSRIFDKYIS